MMAVIFEVWPVAGRQEAYLARAGMFADYCLRVAEVARDYGMTARAGGPADSRAVQG
jgi:hypothetical protein